ncbi:MAG: UTP--glucose-1-phosphate uridylyltransferase, partial [Nitratireductor sp.]|nr:UTP--glucose-1-phosphate uridylyltransferase [Nitratireductor sp.]
IIGNEPFALLLPDMVMQHEKGCMSAMVELYDRMGGNVVSTEAVDPTETHKYGVVEKGAEVEGGFHVRGMVEKPPQGSAPSDLILNGRYILQPEIFGILENQQAGAGGEIQLTDAMLTLAKQQEFFGYTFTGRTFDCGSREGFIKANVAYAMWDREMSASLKPELEALIREIKPL